MIDLYARRYTVRGIDDNGDVKAFHTDCAEAAESVRQQLDGELAHVEVRDRMNEEMSPPRP
jgi:hypothetical protein